MKKDYKINFGCRNCGDGCDCNKGTLGYSDLLLPWNTPELEGWSIIGMNHYYVKGVRHLFVAMTNPKGIAIQAEGIDESKVFKILSEKAAKWQ